MRFFSYGRKSVFSDKSDSIDNQFRMNREYCESKFSGQVDSWQQFSDEDFTGANTSRPDLQRMLSFIRVASAMSWWSISWIVFPGTSGTLRISTRSWRSMA